MERADKAVEIIRSQSPASMVSELTVPLEFSVCKRCRINTVPEDMVGELCTSCHKYRTMKIPARFYDATFKKFVVNDRNRAAFEKAQEFYTGKKGLFMWGTVGAGKTHLACAVATLAFMAENRFNIVTVPDLMSEVRATFGTSKTVRDVVDKYSDGWLFLDDFGAEKPSDFNIDTMFSLIDRRYRERKEKIFITSNLSLQKTAEMFSDRIASRIAEMCDRVELNDSDHRVEVV